MAKKVVGYIKLQVKAGQATPSPPVGPALGQRGLNIMEFCKAFNAATQKMEPGLPIPVIITAYSDRTFTFIMKTPPASILLKKAAGIESGSKRPNTEKVGKVSRKQLEDIAKAKMPDLTAADMDAADQSRKSAYRRSVEHSGFRQRPYSRRASCRDEPVRSGEQGAGQGARASGCRLLQNGPNIVAGRIPAGESRFQACLLAGRRARLVEAGRFADITRKIDGGK